MAVKHLKSKTKAFFEKAFPERQIYHRSGGSVRYVSISPWRQAMMAGAATLIVGWCLFATVAVLLRGPAVDFQTSSGPDRRSARLERDLRSAKAGEQTALALLEKRTEDFNRAISEAEGRHKTLKRVLANLQGQDTASAVALNGENASLLIDSTIEEGDARKSRPDGGNAATNDSAGFRARTDKLILEQAAFLNEAEDEAVGRAERARGVIRLTGVSAARVLEQPGMGGPLVEVDGLSTAALPGAATSDPFGRRVYELEARLQEAQQYERAIHSLPLGAPVDVGYRETSGFGYRSDPFSRRTAFHEGADLAAYYGAPILSTAPGTVTFAGVKGGYGRVVEIDHGGGFKTRYGHLNSITVKAGTKVAIGQKIGTMGSTGRSTGPHLHYEVYYRGKSYDPIKFLRAGKHVYEG
ncbi:MAG: peptidoglycan DD-metalloendopeptidase family protein [Hyphomonadaceae bacterium]|nr:peptidoglycan DD-metalloendopeptidase family protein [Hyphomonadaceae bacterium]